MKRFSFALAALVLAAPAFAQSSTASTDSRSTAETVIQGVGSPTINNYAPAEQTIHQKGLPVTTPGTAFATQPGQDTCQNSGKSAAVQTKVFGFVISGGAATHDPCEARTDARTMSATSQDAVAVTMRLCQTPANAEAFEDAADLRDLVRMQLPPGHPDRTKVSFRCPDRLRPQWAKDQESARASALLNGGAVTAGNTADPYIRERLQK